MVVASSRVTPGSFPLLSPQGLALLQALIVLSSCVYPLSSISGIINFCANNYLGLSSHPEVIQAGLQTLKEFGAGLSSVRFICGTQVHQGCGPGWGRGGWGGWALISDVCFCSQQGWFRQLSSSQNSGPMLSPSAVHWKNWVQASVLL